MGACESAVSAVCTVTKRKNEVMHVQRLEKMCTCTCASNDCSVNRLAKFAICSDFFSNYKNGRSCVIWIRLKFRNAALCTTARIIYTMHHTAITTTIYWSSTNNILYDKIILSALARIGVNLFQVYRLSIYCRETKYRQYFLIATNLWVLPTRPFF